MRKIKMQFGFVWSKNIKTEVGGRALKEYKCV